MKRTQKHYWGIQVITETGEKALCWKTKNNCFYFTTDKKSPPPALFSSKAEAKEAYKGRAIGNNLKQFKRVLEPKSQKIVKVRVSA